MEGKRKKGRLGKFETSFGGRKKKAVREKGGLLCPQVKNGTGNTGPKSSKNGGGKKSKRRKKKQTHFKTELWRRGAFGLSDHGH